MATYYKIKAKEGKTLPANVILPPYKSDDKGTVISIDGSGFADHTEIESFIISENVKYIGANAFDGCTGLEEMTIPASVTSMGASVFNGCDLTIYLNYTENEIAALENWDAGWLNGAATTTKVNYIPTYDIAISSSLVNGSIAVDKITAKAGDTIQLTVTPAEGYKVNWVKYNEVLLSAPYKFIMPAKDVEITAEFAQEENPDTPTTYASITVVAPDVDGNDMETQTIQYDIEQNGYYFEIGSKISSVASTITSQYPLAIEYYDSLTTSWEEDKAAGGWHEEYKDNIYTYTETANTDIAGPIQQRACIKEA